jgi:hypothetical protein
VTQGLEVKQASHTLDIQYHTRHGRNTSHMAKHAVQEL